MMKLREKIPDRIAQAVSHNKPRGAIVAILRLFLYDNAKDKVKPGTYLIIYRQVKLSM